MLSCSCDFTGGGQWYYYPPDDLTIFDQKRRKRCCSCRELIAIGSQCMKFSRCREPRSDIEEEIYGDEVKLASWYLCESCSEIYLNLTAFGYCYYPGDDLRENLRDYWELTGFKPKKEMD